MEGLRSAVADDERAAVDSVDQSAVQRDVPTASVGHFRLVPNKRY